MTGDKIKGVHKNKSKHAVEKTSVNNFSCILHVFSKEMKETFLII